MEVTHVPPERPSRTTGGARTTGWDPWFKVNRLMKKMLQNFGSSLLHLLFGSGFGRIS